MTEHKLEIAAPAETAGGAEILGFRPLYRQVKANFVRRLVEGVWAPGTALPSEGQLASEIGVSQGTVRKALDELAAENLLVRRQGRGTFVAEHDEQRILFQFFKLVPDDGVARFPDSTVLSCAIAAVDPDRAGRPGTGAGGRCHPDPAHPFARGPPVGPRNREPAGTAFPGTGRRAGAEQSLQPVRDPLRRHHRPCTRAAEGGRALGRGGAPSRRRRGNAGPRDRPDRAVARGLARRAPVQPVSDGGGSLPVRSALTRSRSLNHPPKPTQSGPFITTHGGYA
ncbi:MAG: hypothetical protein C0420_01800 [Methylobacterium sp.]|nr:hypothetical protein [Methylobacterium sp.]